MKGSIFLIIMRITNNNFNLHKISKKGITIIELIIVVALMMILTTTVVLRKRDFDNTTLLKNTAYEFALSVREAQAYGVSVYREVGDISGRYGVHISLSSPESSILYSDNNENNIYDSGENRKINIFKKPFSLKNICVTLMSGGEDCANSDPTIKGLEILFIRPNPDAHLYVVRTGGVLEGVSKARVSIGTPEDKTVDVNISSLGQVSVQ